MSSLSRERTKSAKKKTTSSLSATVPAFYVPLRCAVLSINFRMFRNTVKINFKQFLGIILKNSIINFLKKCNERKFKKICVGTLYLHFFMHSPQMYTNVGLMFNTNLNNN